MDSTRIFLSGMPPSSDGDSSDLTLTPATTLELDLATVRNYKVTLAGDALYSEVNFDLTNIPTNILCTFLIVVTVNIG